MEFFNLSKLDVRLRARLRASVVIVLGCMPQRLEADMGAQELNKVWLWSHLIVHSHRTTISDDDNDDEDADDGWTTEDARVVDGDGWTTDDEWRMTDDDDDDDYKQ